MENTFNPGEFESALKRFRKSLPPAPSISLRVDLPDKRAAKLCAALRNTAETMRKMADAFDPVRPPAGQIQLFAPLTIGRLIGQELSKVARQPLAGVGPFHGSGVYALYYSGNFPAYAAISGTDCPIYVGVADPKKRHAKTPLEQGQTLARRLLDHRKNIAAANKTISLNDFQYRYLVTESGWQATAEEFLIWLYQPVWNKEMKVCSGFGKHGDRARSELSAWDILHSGRKWTGHQKSRKGKTIETVTHDIERHYEERLSADPPFWSRILNAEWIRRYAQP